MIKQKALKARVVCKFTYGLTIGFDGCAGVLELHELMAHERPGRKAATVELQGPEEVHDRLLVLALEAVVVTCTDNSYRYCCIESIAQLQQMKLLHPST